MSLERKILGVIGLIIGFGIGQLFIHYAVEPDIQIIKSHWKGG